MTQDAFEKWSRFYRKSDEDSSNLAWPSETLVRLFKGSYIPGMPRDFKGMSVLDVGFGNGNNLLFLASLGLELHGTEVHPDIRDDFQTKLDRLGYKADLRLGTNRELPFEDGSFDFLVSWNVLHYEDCEENMVAAIAEYARVLKPGGRIIISTTGPDHNILENATTLGAHRYRIGKPGDLRVGQVFFYFDGERYIRHYFEPVFADVMVGRTHDHLFTSTLDWFVVTGTKPLS